MTQCQACARKSDLWLCGPCQAKLRAELVALPWWLARLAEAAVGQVKLGDGGRGSTRREPFEGGDEALEPCACGHPEHDGATCGFETREVIVSAFPDDGIEERIELCLCDDYRPKRNQDRLRAQLLAAGRVNARASALYEEIVNVLGVTIRDLCETRGVECPTLRTPAQCALWLAGSTSAVAAGEGAGETFSELCGLTGRIERIINRPIPPRLVGPCPSSVEHDHDRDCRKHHPHACGNRLMAKREAIEVTCRECKRTHNIEYLVNRLINDAGHMRFSVAEIHQLIERLGEHLPVRTFQHWRKIGKIKPAGYRNGQRITISRHDTTDEVLYRLADVRRVMDERKVKA